MRKYARGFTLIEMVVVIGIVAILSIVLVEMFFGQSRLYRAQFSELTILNDARVALDDVDNYTRSATLVLASYSTYTTASETLILQIQSVNSSNQLIPATFDTVVFYLSNGNLMRQVFPHASSTRTDTTKQLAANVTSLNFTYNNADMALVSEITTSLTVLGANNVQDRTVSVSSKSILRNH